MTATVPDQLIGLVVARFREDDGSPAPDQKAHLVESQIEDRVVTNCGRQLQRVEGDGKARLWLTDASQPGAGRVEVCDQCRPHIPAAIIALVEAQS